MTYYQCKVDLYRVWVKPKKSAEAKYGNRSQYTSLSPDEIKAWSKNFTVEKVSKLIPAGSYNHKEYEAFLINGGLSKADQEKQKKEMQFLKLYNKNNKTNFKSIEALLDDKRRKSQEHKRKERARRLLQQKQREEAKAGREAVLRLSALNLGVEKGIITDEVLNTPEAKKLIKEAHHAQRTVITNLIDDIHKTPLFLRKQVKKEIDHIKQQIKKEVDKL